MVDFLTQHGIPAWNGYRYWMAMTPYPGGDDSVEHPSILASHDGDAWEVPDGLTNPIAQPPSGFWPDPDLVYDHATGRLYCFWLGHRVSYSTDGVTWTDPARPIVALSGEVSPAVILDGDTWKMWTVRKNDEGLRTLLYREASDPLGTWTDPVTCDASPPAGWDFWHIDAARRPGGGYAFAIACTWPGVTANTKLWWAESDDGLTLDVGVFPALDINPHGWDATHIYRASIVPVVAEADLTWDLWYSARGSTGAWRIGRTTIARL